MVAAETTAVWDSLFNLYLTIGVVVGVLVVSWLVLTLVRYRARPGAPVPADAPKAGEVAPERGRVGLVVAMALGTGVIMFALAFGTIDAVDKIEEPPADPDALVVNVTGFQFGWSFEYPGGVVSSSEIVAPVDRVVLLRVTSRDVIHSFAVPDFRIRIDAIPGHVNTLWFRSAEPGEGRTVCVELCGAMHAAMKAKVRVVAEDEFAAWLTEKGGGPKRPAVDLAIEVRDGGLAPAELDAVEGTDVRLRVTNAAGVPRGLRLGAPLALATPAIPPGGNAWLNFTAAAAGEIALQPTDAGGRDAGPAGTLRVKAPRAIAVTLADFRIEIADARLVAGETVKFVVTNSGRTPHDFHVGRWTDDSDARRHDAATPLLDPGKSVEILFTPAAPGTLDAWCHVPGHDSLGMRTTLEVVAQ